MARKKSTYQLSEEDKALFQRATQGVKPLGTRNQVDVSSVKSFSPRQKRDLPASATQPPIALSNQLRHSCTAQEVISNHKIGLDKRKLRQLAKGSIALDANLDLHGLSIEHARDYFAEFINHAQHNDYKYLLIVHGKGRQAFGETALMKSFVRQWLDELSCVLAYHSAPIKLGGSGAVLVWLQRS